MNTISMLNKMKKMFYAVCGMCFLLISCREEEVDVCTDPAQRIYLRASVGNAIPMSRAPFSQSELNENNMLKVAVWASTTNDKFEHIEGADGSNGVVALHTAATFSSSEEQLLNDAIYPKDENTTVYFVGMYPETDWNTLDGNQAVRIFDGSEDVMFAPQISGQYGQNLTQESWPTFKFHHLLTWLRVKVKAESEAVSEAWGKLKSIQLVSSVGNTVTIDLVKSNDYDPNDETKTFEPSSCVSFSTDNVTYDFYETGTNDKFHNMDIPLPYNDKYMEVAYVLCAPVVATEYDALQLPDIVRTNEFTLVVTTEKRSVEVPVDLIKEKSEGVTTYFTGNTMNYQFTLNLNFKMGNNISVTASVVDWEAGGISNGVISPD